MILKTKWSVANGLHIKIHQDTSESFPLMLLLLLSIVATATIVSPTSHRVANVPGRAASTHYAASVRAVGSGEGGWKTAYVFVTTAKTSASHSNSNGTDESGCGYFAHLNGWSASWLSIEADRNGDGIEVKVQRIGSGSASQVGGKTGLGAEGENSISHPIG